MNTNFIEKQKEIARVSSDAFPWEPMSYEFLDTITETIIKNTLDEVKRIIDDRAKGWLGEEEDSSDKHGHYDELIRLKSLLTKIGTEKV